MNFKINLIFLIKPFYTYQNIKAKSWEQKELLRWNKYFSSFLKGFQLQKIVSDLRVRLLKLRWKISRIFQSDQTLVCLNKMQRQRSCFLVFNWNLFCCNPVNKYELKIANE